MTFEAVYHDVYQMVNYTVRQKNAPLFVLQ